MVDGVWPSISEISTEPAFKCGTLANHRADISRYLAESARGAPSQTNMCDTDTYAEKYWGPMEKSVSKKKGNIGTCKQNRYIDFRMVKKPMHGYQP